MTKPKFDPRKIKCKNCDTEIYSKYPGHWVACKCWANEEDNKGCFIDSTEHYYRIGGSPENYETTYAGTEDEEWATIINAF